MDLHFIDGSPFARIVRVLAREHGVECKELEVVEFPPADSFHSVNPLGQVPALVDQGHVYFPTRIAIDALLSRVGENGRMIATSVARCDRHMEDEQTLAVILAMGDALAAHHYYKWAGIGPVDRNRLGFDPAERNMTRVYRTLDWLEARLGTTGFQPDLISVQDIALACFILWTESRGPIDWRGRPKIEALIKRLEKRPSFAATTPRPHRLK
jgi:glutathione S-transferase